MSTAREEILRRIRSAAGRDERAGIEEEYGNIERNYQSKPSLSRTEIVDLFEDRLHDYGARVFRAKRERVGQRVTEILAQRSLTTVVIPQGLPSEWLQGAEFVVDRPFTAEELNAFPGVMTTATLGIAETGTVVLQNQPRQGRRALTLVPDYHLCVFPAHSIVETVVEAMRLLEPTKTLPTTFISGPSATADIEMTRIKGVHGPRTLDILLVGEP